jgi:hypothetical protein
MMLMKDCKTMMMDQDMTLSNGTMVAVNGKVTMKDGKTLMIKKGDKLDIEGMMIAKKKMMKKVSEIK